MKKRLLMLLPLVTAAFAIFTLGFFLGRNAGRPTVLTTRIAPAVETVDFSVPEEDETGQTTTPALTEPAYPININTADVQTLTFLPGIGETIAQRIVDYRSANGDFALVTDLLNVKGIGEKRLADILPYITTGQQEDNT